MAPGHFVRGGEFQPPDGPRDLQVAAAMTAAHTKAPPWTIDSGRAMVCRVNVYVCQGARGPLNSVVTVPGSKSLTNRAMIVAALADGSSLIRNALLAEDTHRMIDALRTLNVPVTVDEEANVIEVTGCRGQIPESDAVLHCGNAGTVIRFCTALCALGHGRYELDGSARMRRRPIGGLTACLQRLGCGIEFPGEEGFPPVVVHAGGLDGGQIRVAGMESSQFVSALLLISPYLHGDLLLEIDADLPSRPYIHMTKEVMEDFGVAVLFQDDATGTGSDPRGGDKSMKCIVPAPQRYVGRSYTIEPDASNATYFLTAAAVAGGRVTVEGLGTESTQGDTAFVDILERMGCAIEREAKRLSVSGPPSGSPLRGLEVDLNAMPDTVMTLAAVALFADGPTTIRNVANLRIKESDRLNALATELRKLGAEVVEQAHGLTILPPISLRPAELETYDDHRMAMSFAVIGLGCPGLTIRDPQCCEKSFPDFFSRYERMLAS